MATMKSLVKSKNEQGLWLEEVDVPVPGKNEVLIKILRTAICGTDVHIYNWDEWAQKTIPVPVVWESTEPGPMPNISPSP